MLHTITELTERLTSREAGLEAWLWLPLIRLLAQGDPVKVTDLATTAGRPIQDVRTALAAVPDTEYDEDGRIIGQGLTLRPTPHHFEVDGNQLYTWCALDTLIIPVILGKAARIESSCQATGTPVLVHVDATGAARARPTTAVVSLINPEDIRSVRSAFCNQVHFFASAEAAQPWLQAHPAGSVIPIDEAYQLGASIVETMLKETTPQQPVFFGDGGACGCC